MDKTYSLNLLKCLVILQMLILATPDSKAATITSNLSGSWANPLTWVGSIVPGPGDAVIIVSNHAVSILSGNVSCASLTVEHPNSTAGTSSMTIASGASLTVSGATVISGGANSARLARINVDGTGIFAAVTLQNGVSNNTVFNISSSGVATMNGNITIGSATKLELIGSATLNYGGGSFTNSGTYTVSSTATIGYTSASAQSVPAGSYYNLSLSGSAKTFSSGTIVIGGVFSPGSTTGANAGTIEFSSVAAQSIPAFGYNNLIISGVRGINNVTMEAGEIGVKGALTDNATFVTGSYVTSGNTISYNGSGNQSVAALKYNHLKIDKSAGAVSLTQNLNASNLAGNLVIQSGTLSSGGFSIAGNAEASLYVASGGTLTLSDGSSFPSGFGIETLDGAIIYDGGLLNSTGMTIPARQYGNLNISGNFILGGDVVFDNSSNVKVSGNLTNSATFTGSAIDFNNATIEFNGSGAQFVSGFLTASAFENVLINNSGTGSTDGVTISDNTMTIDGVLTLDAGQLILNGKTLVISSNSASAIVDAGGVIKSESTDNSSKVQWNIGSETGAHAIPFGKSASEPIPFTFDLVSGTAGTITVSTYPTAANNMPYPTGVLDMETGGVDNSANVVDRFWQIDALGAVSPNVTLTFTCTSGEASGVTALRAQRWRNGFGWQSVLPDQTNPTSTSVVVPNVSSFSTWTLSGNNAPLPVELLSFNAKRNGKNVDLSWTTASELNNARFEVERISADGRSVQAIGNVAGAGNSNTIRTYTFTDSHASSGTAYYRIKQIDLDGKYTYSGVAVVSGLKGLVSVMPNPATAEAFIRFEAEQSSEVTLTVLDITGREVYSQLVQAEKGLNNYPLKLAEMKNGLYTVTLHMPGHMIQERIVKQ